MRTFYLLLIAQAVSLVGTHVTGFSLSVWTYQQTGSLTLYGAILVSSIVPGILVAPVAGVVIDRWNRRRTLLIAHVGGGLAVLVLAVAYQLDALTLGIILPMLMVKSAFENVTVLAFTASTATLVPPAQLDRANGLAQLGGGVAQLASPAMGGVLLPLIGIGGIFVIDVVSFVYAVVVLLWVRIPDVAASATPAKDGRSVRAFLSDGAAGMRYLRGQPGLIRLAIIVSFVTFAMSVVQFLFAPLVLSFASLRALGFASSIAGVGLLVGSVVLSVRGQPRRRIEGLLWFMVAQGAVLLIAGAKPSIALATIGAFGVFFFMPFIAGGAQTLWQRTVPLELQGRAFAVRLMLEQLMLTLASVLAAPLSDWVFEPLMAPGGALAGSVGALLGVGKGRGVALLIAVLGLAIMGAALISRWSRPLASLDPAAVDDRPAMPPVDAPALAARPE